MYWDPFEYMRRMQEDMDASFDRFFNREYRRPLLTSGSQEDKSIALARREPILDIVDEKDHYKVIAEMPGINKEDINVEVTEDAVTLKAEVKHEEKKEEKGYFYQERRYGSFQRSIVLPGEVIPDQTTAEYKNGVLELKLKKKHETKTKQHKVEVK